MGGRDPVFPPFCPTNPDFLYCYHPEKVEVDLKAVGGNEVFWKDDPIDGSGIECGGTEIGCGKRGGSAKGIEFGVANLCH